MMTLFLEMENSRCEDCGKIVAANYEERDNLCEDCFHERELEEREPVVREWEEGESECEYHSGSCTTCDISHFGQCIY